MADRPPPLNLESTEAYAAKTPQCIYCDSTKEPLSDEHIAPFSIGGNVVIKKGSCEVCRQETKAFERTCATEMFGAFRLAIGGPMYDRKKWPDTVRMSLLNKDGTSESVEVEWHERPPSLFMMPFKPPGCFTGIPSEMLQEPFLWLPNQVSLRDDLLKAGKPIRMAQFHPQSFTRLLAKIAHGSTIVALRGYSPELDWPARRVVRGDMSQAAEFIGGHTEKTPADENYPHWIQLNTVEKDGKILLVARIRLYAFMGTPIYSVVSLIWPDLKQKNEQTLSVEEFLDTKSIKLPLRPRKTAPT